MLYIKAQAARNDAGTNNFDWSGWIAGWRRIDSEIKSGKPSAPTGSGTFRMANNLYIEQIINYSNRISKTAIKLLGNAICQRASKLRNEPFDKIISLYMNLHRTNILFNLHFQRMSQKRKTSPKNPSYKALIELCKTSNQSQKMSLLSSLKRNLNLEKAHDNLVKYRQTRYTRWVSLTIPPKPRATNPESWGLWISPHTAPYPYVFIMKKRGSTSNSVVRN